jgi:hypothetical protein
MRRITSLKNLLPSQRRRLKRLNEIFKEEKRIPPGTSLFEMKYLYRLERGRKRYQWRKRPSISQFKEWLEAKKKIDPFSNLSIEEILASMARRKDEQGEGSEK